MKKIAAASLAWLSCVAQAQFDARDLDGNGTVDAYYQASQNLTWLADANYYLTSGGARDTNPYIPYSPYQPENHLLRPGEVRLTTAVNWVSNLTIGDYGDWRLPQRLFPEDSPEFICPPTSGCGQWQSWPTELRALSTALEGGTGPFSNVVAGAYMTYNPGLRFVELTSISEPGSSIVTDEDSLVYGYAWAVHAGDIGSAAVSSTMVAAVPEPGTYALMLGGLVLVSLRARRGLAGTRMSP